MTSEMSRWRNRLIPAFVALALPAAAVALPAFLEQRRPVALATSASAPKTSFCGVENVAKVELIPDAVLVKGNSEKIEYHAEISIRRGKDVGVAWEAEVVDDRGALVASKLAVGSDRLADGDTAVTPEISVDLLDGFYSLNLRAAIVPADEASTVVHAEQFLEVKNGIWTELTDLEWRSRSKVTLAHSDVEGDAQ